MSAPRTTVALLVAALSLAAGSAVAGDQHTQKMPSPANSTIPSQISAVGWCAQTGPDSALGISRFVLRDLSNNPPHESWVVLDLSQCPDLRVATVAQDSRLEVVCPSHLARAFYGEMNGTVSFCLVGGGSGGPGTLGPCRVPVYADGVYLGNIPIVIYDLDGVGGLGANDVSLWMGDFGTGEYIGRVDYDGNGRLGANDLSLWLGAFGAAGSTTSGGASCP